MYPEIGAGLVRNVDVYSAILVPADFVKGVLTGLVRNVDGVLCHSPACMYREIGAGLVRNLMVFSAILLPACIMCQLRTDSGLMFWFHACFRMCVSFGFFVSENVLLYMSSHK